MQTFSKVSQFVQRTFIVWVLLISAWGMQETGSLSWVLPQIKYLLGIIMFGMGMTLRWSDFRRVGERPVTVAGGVAAQFLIMPFAALLLVRLFGLPPAIALGVILVGCCPGGTASNVIAFLARADVALSVSITTVSTLLAPLVTPLLFYLLAGEQMEIDLLGMMKSVTYIVLLPVILGLFVHQFLPKVTETGSAVMPIFSVVAIVLIVGAVVEVNATKILDAGAPLFSTVILHNGIGLVGGFLVATLLSLPIASRRTYAIEVGMQNSGLAVALATAHLVPEAAIAGALFSAWHNITGPLLASLWYRSQPKNK
jgi:BASS family bile acid:Na+ symporter